jgi:hypothetical protein
MANLVRTLGLLGVAAVGLGAIALRALAKRSDPPLVRTISFLEQYNAALRGDVKAARTVGLAFLNGVDRPQDLKEAARWLAKAAEHGDPEAKRALASPQLVEVLRNAAEPLSRPSQRRQPQPIVSEEGFETIEVIAFRLAAPLGSPILLAQFAATRMEAPRIPRAKSPSFALISADRRLEDSVAETEERRRLLDALTRTLSAEGWQEAGSGNFWYSKRFKRPV